MVGEGGGDQEELMILSPRDPSGTEVSALLV